MLKIDLLLCNPPDRSRESCANPTNAVSFQCVPCEWNSTLARRVWNFECHTFECVNRSEDFETTKTAVRFWLKIEEMRNLWKQPWKSKTTHQSLKSNINWALKFRRSLSSLKKTAFVFLLRNRFTNSNRNGVGEGGKKQVQIEIEKNRQEFLSSLDIIESTLNVYSSVCEVLH